MVQFDAWLFKGLLGLIWVIPIWTSLPSPQTAPSSSSKICIPLEILNDHLNSSLRRRYLKHNFPINYTIQVRYEEIFRLRNISQLNVSAGDSWALKKLWFEINKLNIKNILNMLPERHPSRHKYLTIIDKIFKDLYESWTFENNEAQSETDYPENIQDILERLNDSKYQRWKSVKPKSLLDNCYRTMHCIFMECFPLKNSSYCNTQHRGAGKGT